MTDIVHKPSRSWADWHEKFVVEERYVEPSVRRRFYVLSSVLVVVGAVAFTILLVGVLTHTGIQRLDVPIERWFDAQRSQGLTGFMIAMAIIFGPVALPIIVFIVVAVWIIAARHVWRPLLLTAGMLTGVITALVLAPIVKHPRPPIGLMLFGRITRTRSLPVTSSAPPTSFCCWRSCWPAGSSDRGSLPRQ